jgi:hypothetical protein
MCDQSHEQLGDDESELRNRSDSEAPQIDIWSVLPALQDLREWLRLHGMPNWPRGIDFKRACKIVLDDGLPLVWVPRAELVREVVDAQDREARVAVLRRHVSELMEDCRSVLQKKPLPTLAGQQTLAKRCVEVLEQGHHEAAQALAAVVIDTAVFRKLPGSSYAEVRKAVHFDPDRVPYEYFRVRAALAPIERFFIKWYPDSGLPPPDALSRHVSIHHADPGHYTPENSLIAVLIACSVLPSLEEILDNSQPDHETGGG